MMTAARRAFREAGSTLPALKNLAKTDAADARAMLRSVKERVAAWSPTHPALPTLAALETAPDLIAAVTQQEQVLRNIFAPEPQLWASLAAARAGTLGWSTDEAASAPHVLTGEVARDPTLAFPTFTITNSAGQTFKLSQNNADPMFSVTWLTSLANHGPVTLKGDLQTDGTFAVRTFSPGSATDFLAGRVVVTGENVFLNTLTGAGLKSVKLTDPTLVAQLKQLPSLGLMVPGTPTAAADGTLELADAVPNFWALGGRFNGTPTTLPNGNVEIGGQFANSRFNGPVELPAATTVAQPDKPARVPNPARALGFGHFELGADGKLARFIALDVTGPADAGQLPAAQGQRLDPLTTIAQLEP